MSVNWKLLGSTAILPILMIALTSHALSQNAEPKTAAEMAEAIASTINANTAKTPIGAIAFEGATADKSVVEIRYATTDAQFFASAKAGTAASAAGFVSYYCNERRISYLQNGVVIRIILSSPDKRDSSEIAIDKSTCAKQIAPPRNVDAKTLSELAKAAALKENEGLTKQAAAGRLLRFEGATSDGATIEEKYIVSNPSALGDTAAAHKAIVDMMRGYLCSQHSRLILDGIAFKETFNSTEGILLLNISLDRHTC